MNQVFNVSINKSITIRTKGLSGNTGVFSNKKLNYLVLYSLTVQQWEIIYSIFDYLLRVYSLEENIADWNVLVVILLLRVYSYIHHLRLMSRLFFSNSLTLLFLLTICVGFFFIGDFFSVHEVFDSGFCTLYDRFYGAIPVFTSIITEYGVATLVVSSFRVLLKWMMEKKRSREKEKKHSA